MTNHRKSPMGTNRDFGISTNGKGSADRTTNRNAFEQNFDDVSFGGVDGLKKVGTKLVKTYGKPARPADVFAENESEWQPLGSIHQTATTPTKDICRE